MSQYVLLRIQAIEKELEALKKTITHQLQGSQKKTKIQGLWQEITITDQDLEEAEKAVCRDLDI